MTAGAGLCRWLVLLPFYARGLSVALRYNRAAEALIEARISDYESVVRSSLRPHDHLLPPSQR